MWEIHNILLFIKIRFAQLSKTIDFCKLLDTLNGCCFPNCAGIKIYIPGFAKRIKLPMISIFVKLSYTFSNTDIISFKFCVIIFTVELKSTILVLSSEKRNIYFKLVHLMNAPSSNKICHPKRTNTCFNWYQMKWN